jgi:hypothetical protein
MTPESLSREGSPTPSSGEITLHAAGSSNSTTLVANSLPMMATTLDGGAQIVGTVGTHLEVKTMPQVSVSGHRKHITFSLLKFPF